MPRTFVVLEKLFRDAFLHRHFAELDVLEMWENTAEINAAFTSESDQNEQSGDVGRKTSSAKVDWEFKEKSLTCCVENLWWKFASHRQNTFFTS